MTGEYALRAMLYICSKPFGNVFRISEISSENEIPEKFLRKIIPLLSKAGLLKTRKGNGGGIILEKRPDKITPLDIIESVEGKISLNKCLLYSKFCARDGYCSIHIVWAEAQKQLKKVLSEKNMEELAVENSMRYLKFVSASVA